MTFCMGRSFSTKLPIEKHRETVGCTYTAKLDPMLIKRRPFDHIGFEAIVDLCNQLECQSLQSYRINILQLDNTQKEQLP